MINKNYFVEKIKELADLMGVTVKVSTVNALYEKLSHYDVADFSAAVDDLASSSDKLSLHGLRTRIENQASIRREKEQFLKKQKEADEAKAFWAKEYTKNIHCNRRCGKCNIIYCDIIAAEAMKAIKELLQGQATTEEVQNRLIKMFPGAGFEPEPF